ncbi:MAG: hypothetical protein AAFX39_12005 [Pseudomonadota bacterium]
MAVGLLGEQHHTQNSVDDIWAKPRQRSTLCKIKSRANEFSLKMECRAFFLDKIKHVLYQTAAMICALEQYYEKLFCVIMVGMIVFVEFNKEMVRQLLRRNNFRI